VLYFLQPTTVALNNGCLLVVPGYSEGPQHSDRVTTPMEHEHPIETEVGDVIVFDPRLLHGSLPNETEEYRFNIRLWIQTRWKETN
jgi:ectoine hydroxylase-related dioxygenase (phytanoyl-CoA dioxygenase family)